MEKEFIPYEQALVLKELGFDEPCFAFYSKIYGLMTTSPTNKVNEFAGEVILPLYQQAFLFFREKYNLYSTIVLISNSPKDRAYMPMIDYIYPHKAIMDFVEYETPEEAELECLKKLIEIVKNDVEL